MHPQTPTHQHPPTHRPYAGPPVPSPRPPAPGYPGPAFPGPSHPGPAHPGPAPAGFGRPAPPMPPAPIRPHAIWIVVTWVLCGLAGIGALAGIGLGALSAVRAAAPAQAFATGEWVEFTVAPGGAAPVVYALATGPTDMRCDVVNPAGPAPTLRPADGDSSLRVDDRNWELVFHLDGAGPGTYRLTCDAEGAWFGVGTAVDAAGVGGTTLLWALAAFGALVAAIVVTVVLVSRRRAARAASWAGAHPAARPW